MEKEKNLQKVSFKLGESWYSCDIDLKRVYSSVHSAAKTYGSSANMLVNEMFANLLELVFQKKIKLDAPLVITDYGCGHSKATNVLAMVIAENAEKILTMVENGRELKDILREMGAAISEVDAREIKTLPQTSCYRNVTVQRYDIGIAEYARKPEQKAQIVFCNDVFEHIPEEELPAFIAGLEEAGKYIFASISLRDAVNYKAIPEGVLWETAQKVEAPSGIVLTKDLSGDYIFSLHVSVLPVQKWQEILGEKWTLLPAQDYTAVSAMNFRPSETYQMMKIELISQLGFADFIPFPTKLGSRYEKDQILWRRTALMQPQKHIQKLNVLENYPEGSFRELETRESLEFLAFVGAKIKKENGIWKIERLPYFLDKLSELEELAKRDAHSDEEVRKASRKIIKGI